jgi:hypothetical protein
MLSRSLLLCAFGVSALHATSVIAPTFPELVAESTVIARVEVTAIHTDWVDRPEGRVIKTFVTFSVLRALKGQPDGTITLPFLGGELAGESMRVEGMPRFIIGQTDILFLSDLSGARFSPLVGLMHGRYRVLTDATTARTYVARNDGAPLESESDVQLPQSATSPANRLKSVSRALSPAAFEDLVTAETTRPAHTR